MADQFHFISQPLAADGTVTARVVTSSNGGTWAKGGVMLRASAGDPDPSAPYYGVFMTPNNGSAATGVDVQWRATEGASTNQILVNGALPNYLRIVRWTDTSASVTYYQAQTSPDGTTWTAVPGSLQPMASLTGSLLAGMATDSWNQGTAATWTIDNVAVTAGEVVPQGLSACPSGWTCQDIGGATPAGSQSLSAGSWTVQAGGNDIWATSDSVPPHLAVSGGRRVGQR